MTKRQRHQVYEGLFIIAAAFTLVFAVPTLLSEHDSIAALAAALMILLWLSWVVMFLYRVLSSQK